MMHDTYRKVFAVSLAVLAGLALVAVLLGQMGRNGPGSDSVTGLPRDESARANLKHQFERQSAERIAKVGPALLLTDDQRSGWTTAWNRMRDCAISRGFYGVQAVSPSFGDGKTPAPVVHLTPAGATVMKECPFDTSLFDVQKVAKALEQAGSH